MDRSLRGTLAAGLSLALFAALLVDHGGHFGLELTHVAVLGAALGAVLGLVPDRSPVLRASAFGVGFLAAWAGYALRAAVLPDIPLGRAIAAFLVIAVVTAAAALTRGRLPLWAGLVGVATLVGAYETTFGITPTAFTTESVTAATTALLAAAVGYLAAGIVGELTLAAEPLADEISATPSARATEQGVPGPRSGIEILTERTTRTEA